MFIIEERKYFLVEYFRRCGKSIGRQNMMVGNFWENILIVQIFQLTMPNDKRFKTMERR